MRSQSRSEVQVWPEQANHKGLHGVSPSFVPSDVDCAVKSRSPSTKEGRLASLGVRFDRVATVAIVLCLEIIGEQVGNAQVYECANSSALTTV
jgi:hypothetical protein